MTIKFILNGAPVEADCEVDMTLLQYLRSQGLFSVKNGCDKGECGACSVLLNDRVHNACLLLMPMVEDCRIETIEGLNQPDQLLRIQEQFLNSGAVQCGYCTPSQILALTALMRLVEDPDETQIREALSGVLCRCTGYVKPVEAIKS